MAIREVRLIFKTENPEEAKSLNISIGGPFTWYFDGLMRGRFKEYSGSEVKGINLVNLVWYSPKYLGLIEERSGHKLDQGWLQLLNTYQREEAMDMSVFSGSRNDNVLTAIEKSLNSLQKLDVPQMKSLVAHVKQSIGINSIEKAIEKSDSEFSKICEFVEK